MRTRCAARSTDQIYKSWRVPPAARTVTHVFHFRFYQTRTLCNILVLALKFALFILQLDRVLERICADRDAVRARQVLSAIRRRLQRASVKLENISSVQNKINNNF